MRDGVILTENLLEMIVSDSFKKGESWGVTYSTWFTPEEGETEDRIKTIIKGIVEMINNS